MIRCARTLPSSTPHWSNESIFQITPCVNTECSYRATSLPKVSGVSRSAKIVLTGGFREKHGAEPTDPVFLRLSPPQRSCQKPAPGSERKHLPEGNHGGGPTDSRPAQMR